MNIVTYAILNSPAWVVEAVTLILMLATASIIAYWLNRK